MQIVSVSSLKGGVGKTSVTLGLASAALHAGVATMVIDLDPHADASTALGVRAGRGADVGAVLRRPRRAGLARIAVASSWTRHPVSPDGAPSLDVAPGSAASSGWDRAAYRPRDLARLSTALTDVTGYDLVLVDCPPSLTALTRMAWAASDTVLSVAEPSLFSVAGSKRTMTALAQLDGSGGRSAPAAGVVVNRVRADSTEHAHRLAELHELFDPLVVAPVLPEEPVLQQIQGAAWPVHRWPGERAAELAGRFSVILAGLRGAAGN